MRGKPLFSRATLVLLRPKHQILGVDIAGQVEPAGSGVTRFKPGDEVYANLLTTVTAALPNTFRCRRASCRLSRRTCRSRKRLQFRWRR